MQKIRAYATCLLVCFVSLGSTVSAQGFYEEYVYFYGDVSTPERILCLPGGGYGLPISRGAGRAGWVETDANGNAIVFKDAYPSEPGLDLSVINQDNYVVLDTTFNPAAPSQHKMKLTWFDFDYNILQTITYDPDPQRGLTGAGLIITDTAGHFHIAALYSNAQNQTAVYIFHIDENGSLLAQHTADVPGNLGLLSFTSLEIANDGAYLLGYTLDPFGGGNFITRVNTAGGSNWSSPSQADAVGYNPNGDLLLGNGTSLTFTNASQSTVATIPFSTYFSDLALGSTLQDIVWDGDGWIVVYTPNLAGILRVHILKLDPAGNLIWKRNYGFWGLFIMFNTTAKLLPDGTLLLGGNHSEIPYLLKLNPDGVVYPHSIAGHVWNDLNGDCVAQTTDAPLKQMFVSAQRLSDGWNMYAQTDTSGYYEFTDVDTGAYWVHVDTMHYLWTSCDPGDTLTFASLVPAQQKVVDFLMLPTALCPALQTNFAVDRMRPCFQSRFVLYTKNNGTIDATDAYVDVTLPPEFTIDSASEPYTTPAPGVLRFENPNVPINETWVVYLYATLVCDNTLMGQTLCATAHPYPDTMCIMGGQLANWSGATVALQAQCDADSVRFELINIGTGDMESELEYVIVEDHVITYTGQFQLLAGKSMSIALPKDGATWRMRADQEMGHPFNSQAVSLALEGCVDGGSFTTQMVNLFPNHTGVPGESVLCRLVTNAYDPNQKSNYPLGVDAPHYIERNTALEYQLDFQNTGNDVAYNVLLRDTLSPWLDPSTLEVGAASFPYTYRLSGPGILEFRFDGINLPDSTSNEPGSHGFVQFKIKQRPNLALGTVIANTVGIYFDFNEVVLTNTVYNTVDSGFLEVVLHTVQTSPELRVHVMPNPATESAVFELESTTTTNGTLKVFDMMGRPVRTLNAEGNRWVFYRQGLPSGIYPFQILDHLDSVICTGKIILK